MGEWELCGPEAALGPSRHGRGHSVLDATLGWPVVTCHGVYQSTLPERLHHFLCC